MRRIIIFERVLTHYRLRFYNYIVENNPNIEIIFLTGPFITGKGFHTKVEDAKFSVKILPVRTFLGLEMYKWPIELLKSADSIVCVISLSSISNILYSAIARIYSIPFFWWGHSMNFAQNGFFERIKDKLKLISISWSTGILAYTDQERENFKKYSFLRKKYVIPLGNTLDTESIISINSELHRHILPHNTLVKQLENKSIIGLIGRLHEKRNAGLAIELFLEILADRKDIVLLIIGDGEEYYRLKECYSSIENIIFLGGIEDEKELAYYMNRIEFFIHTGLVGLNLVHGMCYGKPSLALDLPIHSPEIDYLKNGENGLLLKDIHDMKVAILSLLSNREEIKRMGQNALNDIKTIYNIKRMADNFLKILD